MIKSYKAGVHIHKGFTFVFTKKTPEKEILYWLEKFPELENKIIFTSDNSNNTNGANGEAESKQSKAKPKRGRKPSTKKS